MVAHDVHLRRAGATDLPATRTVLARALAHDPLMDWIFGPHPYREAAVAALLGQPIETYTLAGTAWLAMDGGRAVGAAAWSVPGPQVLAADGGPALPGRSILDLLVPTAHVARVRSGFEAMHGQLPDEPHALLHFLGVDADRRRQGIGSRLVRAGLDALPGTLPAHVNTTVEANARLYEAHGFVRAAPVRLGAHGPVMLGLRRPAAG